MRILESLGSHFKAAAAALSPSLAPARETPFSAVGGYGVPYNSGAYASGLLPNMSPGSKADWAKEVGDPLDNRVVLACASAIAQAHTSVPIVLQRRHGDDWKPVLSHPLIDLLNFPNPDYSADDLWGANIEMQCARGNGFWRAVMNRSRTQPVELWFEPFMTPEYGAQEFIKDYWLRVDGKPIRQIPAGQFKTRRREKADFAIHFRYQIDPMNPRMGKTPISTVYRQIHGDNLVATHQVTILKNGLVASKIVSSKEGTTVGTGKLEDFEARAEKKLRGDGAGKMLISNLPIDVHDATWSPEQVGLHKLPNYFEMCICAQLKVHPMILALLSGDANKTYSNFGESLRDFWHRTVIPLQNRNCSALETQLFPMFGLDRNEYRLECDRSQVDAIKDDEKKLFEMLFGATQKPFMTRNEARSRVHLAEVPQWDTEDLNANPEGTAQGGAPWSPEEDKALRDGWETLESEELAAQLPNRTDDEILARAQQLGLDESKAAPPAPSAGGGRFEESKHPRDHGKFASTGGAKIPSLQKRKARKVKKNNDLSYRVEKGHQMPREGFVGERGNSLWVPPDDRADVHEALQGFNRKGVLFRKGFPIFDPFQVKLTSENGRKLSSRIYMEFTGDREEDFKTADEAYAKKLGWFRKNGKPDKARVKNLRKEQGLTWHHVENCRSPKMILVPTVIHDAVHHAGGFSLCSPEE